MYQKKVMMKVKKMKMMKENKNDGINNYNVMNPPELPKVESIVNNLDKWNDYNTKLTSLISYAQKLNVNKYKKESIDESFERMLNKKSWVFDKENKCVFHGCSCKMDDEDKSYMSSYRLIGTYIYLCSGEYEDNFEEFISETHKKYLIDIIKKFK